MIYVTVTGVSMELNGHPASLANLATLGLYNYGHFTSMRVEDGRVRGLALHLDRLVRDCRAVFDTELDVGRVRQLVRQALDQAPSPVVVRVTVFAPGLELGHPGAIAEPQVLITTRPAPTGKLLPLRLQAVRYERDLPAIKHVGLFSTVYLRRQAQRAGFDDVLFSGPDSHITEGATWNVGFLDGLRVVWPEANWLPGVTMRLVQEALPALGLESITAPISLDELESFGAAFITNAGVGVRAVRSIDQVTFTNLDSVQDIQSAYLARPGEDL